MAATLKLGDGNSVGTCRLPCNPQMIREMGVITIYGGGAPNTSITDGSLIGV